MRFRPESGTRRKGSNQTRPAQPERGWGIADRVRGKPVRRSGERPLPTKAGHAIRPGPCGAESPGPSSRRRPGSLVPPHRVPRPARPCPAALPRATRDAALSYSALACHAPAGSFHRQSHAPPWRNFTMRMCVNFAKLVRFVQPGRTGVPRQRVRYPSASPAPAAASSARAWSSRRRPPSAGPAGRPGAPRSCPATRGAGRRART